MCINCNCVMNVRSVCSNLYSFIRQSGGITEPLLPSTCASNRVPVPCSHLPPSHLKRLRRIYFNVTVLSSPWPTIPSVCGRLAFHYPLENSTSVHPYSVPRYRSHYIFTEAVNIAEVNITLLQFIAVLRSSAMISSYWAVYFFLISSFLTLLAFLQIILWESAFHTVS